jgi:hypothetical protein
MRVCFLAGAQPVRAFLSLQPLSRRLHNEDLAHAIFRDCCHVVHDFSGSVQSDHGAKTSGLPLWQSRRSCEGAALANDSGQPNATGEKSLTEATALDNVHSMKSLSLNQNDHRLLEKPGAGLLPKVRGLDIKIELLVKEGTKANAWTQ